MAHDPAALAFAALYGVSILAVAALFVYAARRPMVPPPDPAFRKDRAVREDEQWAGIEAEWHQFVDSFGEVQR